MDYAFDWDLDKELKNILKHGVSFGEAREVFRDPKVIHLMDDMHSSEEERFYASYDPYFWRGSMEKVEEIL